MLRILLNEMVIRKKVVDCFKHIDFYRARIGIIHEEDPFSLNFISSRSVCEDKVLSVGGTSVAFLDLVHKNTEIKEAYNAELVLKITEIR